MTPDRRRYTERDTTRSIGRTVGDYAREVDRLTRALDEARTRLDGQAWADLEADRDRYRDALRQLLAGIAASPRPDQRNWVEARVYLPDLDDAREMMRGAS